MRGEHVFRASTTLPRPPEQVFPFFAEAANLERITPPELGFEIVTPGPIEMRAGALIDYRLSLFGVGFRWRTVIEAWDPPREFVDVQLEGPYRTWVHRHAFRPDGAGGTIMEDEVRWALPLWPAGELARPLVALQLRRIFGYRQRAIRRLIVAP